MWLEQLDEEVDLKSPMVRDKESKEHVHTDSMGKKWRGGEQSQTGSEGGRHIILY